jgi:hypothetical protein
MSNLVLEPKPKAKAKISAAEEERRREALRQADAHNRIEGKFPSPQAAPFLKLLCVVTSSVMKSSRAFTRFIASADLWPATPLPTD